MIIAVASGKGGTGKTTVAVSLALVILEVQLLDCDVEEPNSHIFIRPAITDTEAVPILVPKIDEEKCTSCGRCSSVCVYNAIAVLGTHTLVFPELCHGCGACSYFCPEGAIEEVPRNIGTVEAGSGRGLKFVHGILNVGEAMSPPLIRAVKRHTDKNPVTIIDAPPGTSCPVITSIKGSDFCILVTEPTPFGLNDLMLSVEVLRKMRIPFGAVINRCDIGNRETVSYCKKERIPILMEIPFRREIASAYSKGIPIVEAVPEYRGRFIDLYKSVLKLQGMNQS
ncbi:MAG: ATP-binding protein [Spirochaetes bacterium]|nr:ATP-binding protein [Spirochaetota bacterium]